MKIVQVIFSLSAAGAERLVVDLSNALSAAGEEVLVCTLLSDAVEERCFYRKELSPEVVYHCMGFTTGFSIRKSVAFRHFLEQIRPDVIHCHLNVLPYIYGFALRNKDVKVVHTLHSIAPNTVARCGQVNLNRFFYRKLIVPVTLSSVCAVSFSELYRLPTPVVIENGRNVNISASSDIDSVRREVAGYIGNSGAPVFLHIGRFAPVKNHRRLIDSFNRLKENGTPFVLLVIGGGFDSDAAAILRKDACSDIHFLGIKRNVEDYYMCSDAFCLCSDYEGMPITLIEALSYGVTPVVTPAGGVMDMVKDGETGYVSDDFSVDSYVRKLESFIASPLQREKLMNYYKSRFDMHLCAEKYLTLYRR